MKINVHPLRSFGLWRIMRDLRKISDTTEPELAIESARRALNGHVDRLRPGSVDADHFRAIDGIVDSFLSTHLRHAHERHRGVTHRLDALSAKVAQYRHGADVLYQHDLIRLNDLDAALTHALDRVADPDTPFFDPRQRTERS